MINGKVKSVIKTLFVVIVLSTVVCLSVSTVVMYVVSKDLVDRSQFLPRIYPHYADVLWDQIVEYRLASGNKMEKNQFLCDMAIARSYETLVGEFNHDEFFNRMYDPDYRKYTYTYKNFGENLVIGATSPEEAMQGWLGSPEHKAILDNNEFAEGCVKCLDFNCALIVASSNPNY